MNQVNELPTLLSAEEFAARRGGMPVRRLLDWRRMGVFDAVRDGKNWLFRVEDLTKPVDPQLVSRKRARLASQEQYAVDEEFKSPAHMR